MSGRRSSPTTWRCWPGSPASDPTQRHRPRRCCSRCASTRLATNEKRKIARNLLAVVTNDLLRPNCGRAPALPPHQARKNPVYGQTLASAVLSTGYRPLGSCFRAAGWSAATLCSGPSRTAALPRSQTGYNGNRQARAITPPQRLRASNPSPRRALRRLAPEGEAEPA